MKNLYIREYHIKVEKNIKNKKLRIVFLSDIHNKCSGEQGQAILETVGKCRPDMVLIGGDVIIGLPQDELETAGKFVNMLAETYPVWYANGNHEQRIQLYPQRFGDMAERYDKLIEKTKAVRLINEKEELMVNDIPITIYGLEPEARFYKKGKCQTGMLEQIEKTFGKPDPHRFTVLLSHHPKYEKDYFEWGADLTLSGHYHGGVALLGRETGLITPDFHLFSNKCCGIKKQGTSYRIISAGTGEHTIPFRIHNPREITFIQVEF